MAGGKFCMSLQGRRATEEAMIAAGCMQRGKTLQKEKGVSRSLSQGHTERVLAHVPVPSCVLERQNYLP